LTGPVYTHVYCSIAAKGWIEEYTKYTSNNDHKHRFPNSSAKIYILIPLDRVIMRNHGNRKCTDSFALLFVV